MTYQEALRNAQELLSRRRELVDRGTAASEAEQIVSAAFRRATGKALSRLELFSRMGDAFPPEAERLSLEWALARASGRILQHLTGTQVFLDHEYRVGPEVLVPRPETEGLVLHAIEALRAEPGLADLGLEVGLGSGIISIELLSTFGQLRMRASELSGDARRVAEENAFSIIGPRASDRLEIVTPHDPLAVIEPFLGAEAAAAGFLISNPPYLVPGTEVEQEVRLHEPAAALFAPLSDPLHFYREIATRGREVLRPGGLVFLELAHERAGETLKLFESVAWDARILLDLNGRPRILSGRLGK